jgi:hypothetical protein
LAAEQANDLQLGAHLQQRRQTSEEIRLSAHPRSATIYDSKF